MQLIPLIFFCHSQGVSYVENNNFSNDSEDENKVPYINKYMSINVLERNLNDKIYKTHQSFFSDAKYILHNTCIDSSKYWVSL